MPIILQQQQIQDALADLDRAAQRTLKRPLRVRWHDGEVAHVHLLPVDLAEASPEQDLIVLSESPLDLNHTGSSVPCQTPLRLACWRDVNGHAVVHVVQTPAADDSASEISFIPTHEEIFSRHRGLIETDHLHSRRVAIFGVGSIGSSCAIELAKCGVGKIDLIDHDRLELHNIARHACGVEALGRRKVYAVRDLLLDKNPACRIESHHLDVLADPDITEQIVRQADVVLIATDNNASRLLINALCIHWNKQAIFGRAMTRACGLDVIRVRPGQSPCYQCLLDTILAGRNEEISTPRQAEALAYADHPVRAEPGLSNDLMPAIQIMVKLAMQHLLQKTDSELRSLDADLTADLYFWANRRTDEHPGLVPMGVQAGQPTILRWYGVDLAALPRCSTCAAADCRHATNCIERAQLSN